MVGDLWMKAFLEIHMEGVHSVTMYMIEICICHRPLLAICGLTLEEIMMRIMLLPEITEGMTLITAITENIMSLIHTKELIDFVIIFVLLTTTMNLAVTVMLVLIGTKGLEVETVRSFMVSLKTATTAPTKAERAAMTGIMNMGVTATI